MKTFKKPKEKGEQTFIQGSISKSPKKYSRSPGPQHPKRPVGKEETSTNCRVPPQLGDYNSDIGGLGAVSQLPSDVKPKDGNILHSSSKMKLQLFPIDERFRIGLEKDGHNPFVELTLSARKKISSVLKHLCNKWGSSSIAMGELMLFPFNIASDDLLNSKRWTSSETRITAGDVHATIGSPEVFRLRYGWFQANTSSSSCPNHVHVENVCRGTMEDTSNSRNETDRTRKQLKSCNENELRDVAVEQTVPSELLNQASHKNQHEVNSVDFKPTKSSKLDNDTAVEGNYLDEPYRNETSLLWSDLSNISIGGLLSEASMQGQFNREDSKLGGSRLASHSIASDSLDAFIEQFKHPQASTTLSPDTDVPSSILDAESTCHSFAFSKPSATSIDLPSFQQSAFSGLSEQKAASESFKCPKSEVTSQGGVTGNNTIPEAKTDSLSCSLGVLNSENSLGLSSLKWNDSLGPFDLPLTARQIIKDDSVSIGRYVR
ncbi:TSL-kinase interacting protein 1 [Bienertia sinuspersici]